jgi:hypothetical protein
VSCSNDFLSGSDRALSLSTDGGSPGGDRDATVHDVDANTSDALADTEGSTVVGSEAGADGAPDSGDDASQGDGGAPDAGDDASQGDGGAPDASDDASQGDGGAPDASDDASQSDDGASDAATVCEGGVCPPVALVSFAVAVQGIAVDTQNVYFTDPFQSVIWRCAVGGCGDQPSPVVFTGAGATPQAITTRGGELYWLEYSANGALASCPGSGYNALRNGLVSPVSYGLSLATDANAIYWVENGTGNVSKCVNGMPCPQTLVTGRSLTPSFGGGIAVDASNVYWSDTEGILKCAIGGCSGTPSSVVAGANASWMVMHGANVYWADDVQHKIFKCAIDGCGGADGGSPVTLAFQAGAFPQGMVVDDDNVYWTDMNTNQVLRCAVNGCNNAPTVMASVDPDRRPCRIAMDDAHIYWATCPANGAGTLYVQPK